MSDRQVVRISAEAFKVIKRIMKRPSKAQLIATDDPENPKRAPNAGEAADWLIDYANRRLSALKKDQERSASGEAPTRAAKKAAAEADDKPAKPKKKPKKTAKASAAKPKKKATKKAAAAKPKKKGKRARQVEEETSIDEGSALDVLDEEPEDEQVVEETDEEESYDEVDA